MADIVTKRKQLILSWMDESRQMFEMHKQQLKQPPAWQVPSVGTRMPPASPFNAGTYIGDETTSKSQYTQC